MRQSSRPPWVVWRDYATMIGERQTTLWLCVVYYCFVAPTWVLSRVLDKRFFVRPGA